MTLQLNPGFFVLPNLKIFLETISGAKSLKLDINHVFFFNILKQRSSKVFQLIKNQKNILRFSRPK